MQGLTGDLRRVISTPLHNNFSLRIHLLGYDGTLSDVALEISLIKSRLTLILGPFGSRRLLFQIGYWEQLTDVHVNMSHDSRAQWQRNVQVSDELKPHFRVTTIMERPYVMLKKNWQEMEPNSRLEGFCIDLLAELSRDLGFTFTIHVVKDQNYGNDVDGNGTWDGMIGEILRGVSTLENLRKGK
ncbi:unnamed protein product [Gongylonema pulchrum]|uniref:Lig_chan-Glu_bd domain-containing protein n=1 Tax=Gongylonema pulchrum TaxID=637853 RepID=A0A183DJZ5_9BILA|nr:unnamed protein product [Gongylonema pulchrum]